MEYVLNELSLCGQYADRERFATEGVKPLLDVISTLSSFGIRNILKKSTFFDLEVSKGQRLHELTSSRMSASVLAVCSQLSKMQREPFWDSNPMQDQGKKYFLRRQGEEGVEEDKDVSGTGIAEAYERKGCLISFRGGGYDELMERVRREDESDYREPAISNIHDKEETELFLFGFGLCRPKDGFYIFIEL